MLLDAVELSLAYRSDGVIGQLPESLTRHMSLETHAAVVELATGIHTDVGTAVTELGILRVQLAEKLRALALVPACAGMHPLEPNAPSRVTRSMRYRLLEESLRSLARREPTLGLHVHIGVADPEAAVQVLNRLRENVPVLLALSANSPFLHGCDSGFASTRTPIFRGFPRTGAPRMFGCYAEYVAAIDALIACGAVPDPTFLWWDVRLQPRLGTVEVRVMDAQSRVAETASLVALVQSLARLELEGEALGCPVSPEVLSENCFLAARDGVAARLIDPARRMLVPLRTIVRGLIRACRPHAAALGCAAELEAVQRLAVANGAVRQRQRRGVRGDLTPLLVALADEFVTSRPSTPTRIM